MTLTTWSDCSGGTRVGFGVWDTGGHNVPPPKGATPGASQVIWAFFNKTAVAPLPK
jgi:poly(3-hydroxybutyrate) depolymerase